MELIVFTNNGRTYYFYDVENFKPSTAGFSFNYSGGVKWTAKNLLKSVNN